MVIRTDHSALAFMFRSENLTGRIARWACLLSKYDFKMVTRQGKSHLNADGLSRCLPKGGHNEVEVEEEDEPKVFSLMARASPTLEDGGDRIQLSKVAARLSRKYDDDGWYCDIMATLRRNSTGEPIMCFERFSWSPPSGLLLRRDEDGSDKVVVLVAVYAKFCHSLGKALRALPKERPPSTYAAGQSIVCSTTLGLGANGLCVGTT